MSGVGPLQVLIFRHEGDEEALHYEDAIVRAYQGGKEARGYIPSMDDLGIQLEAFSSAPQLERGVGETLDAFCHTLTIVLLGRRFFDDNDHATWDWLAECWLHTNASGGRHGLLITRMEDAGGCNIAQRNRAFENYQISPHGRLEEHAVRPAVFALCVLHESRLLLAKGLPNAEGAPEGFMRLFISHAKLDGLPLAMALTHLIKSLGLESFYDAQDIKDGKDWKRELEHAASSSVIIMLRTDIYDTRPWCREEVFWSEEYATPAVLVEARTRLNHPPGELPFDRVPTVRIPDGDLLRILFLAVREGLRFLYFMERVEQMKRDGALPNPVELRVFSLQPSMPALLRACSLLSASGAALHIPRMILYPDPCLRAGYYEAANALVDSKAPGTDLTTPQTLAAKGAAP